VVPTNPKVTIQDLRKAIPDHCFESSYINSFWYLFRDLVIAFSTAALAYYFIPQITTPAIRYIAWAAYGFIQGLTFTGIWVSIPVNLDLIHC